MERPIDMRPQDDSMRQALADATRGQTVWYVGRCCCGRAMATNGQWVWCEVCLRIEEVE